MATNETNNSYETGLYSVPMIKDFYDALAATIDFDDNIDKFDEIFQHYIEVPDKGIDVFDFSYAEKFNLTKVELLCFNGLFFLRGALQILEEIETGESIDQHIIDVLSINISLGSAIFGIIVSRVDLDDIEQKLEFVAIKTKLPEIQKLAATGEKVKNGANRGGLIRKIDDNMAEVERDRFQAAINKIMEKGTISFSRALDIVAKEFGISRSTLKRRGVKNTKAKKQ